MGEVSLLMNAARTGDAAARRRLFDHVYRDLRTVALPGLEAQGGANRKLDAAGVVYETFLRLSHLPGVPPMDRERYAAVAAPAIRAMAVDLVRERRAAGRTPVRISLTDDVLEIGTDMRPAPGPDVEALDAALSALETVAHDVAQMRCFAGMSFESIARELEIGPVSVKRSWREAKALLAGRIGDG